MDAETAPIAPQTPLYRRVAPKLGNGYVLDENRQCLRLSSAAFAGQEMSVFLGDTMAEEGRDPLEALTREPTYFLVAITAADAVAAEQEVRRTPLADEPAHGDVVGKKTRPRRRALAEAASWLKAPEELCPDQRIGPKVTSSPNAK